MTEPLAFFNGQLLPQSRAQLALNDAGVVFGATVTDLCRTFRHRLYRWADHLARFRRGCQLACVDVRLSDDEITRHAEALIAHNAALIERHADLALVLIATPGPIGYYFGESTAAGDKPTFAMHTFPLPFARYRPWIESGVRLKTVQGWTSVEPHIKHRSRLHWWIAQRKIGNDAQALMFDREGFVTETASANFLLVKDGIILSPPRENVLEGISLQVVTELCDKLRASITFRSLTLNDCYAADEALLTCTSYCISGVSQLNDHVYRFPGPMLKRLHDAWSTEVGLDIHAQITHHELHESRE